VVSDPGSGSRLYWSQNSRYCFSDEEYVLRVAGAIALAASVATVSVSEDVARQ